MASFQTNFRDAIYDYLDEQIAQIDQVIVTGNAADWADYHHWVGMRVAMTRSRDAFVEIETNLQRG